MGSFYCAYLEFRVLSCTIVFVTHSTYFHSQVFVFKVFCVKFLWFFFFLVSPPVVIFCGGSQPLWIVPTGPECTQALTAPLIFISFQRPLSLGADICMYSATKYMNGKYASVTPLGWLFKSHSGRGQFTKPSVSAGNS